MPQSLAQIYLHIVFSTKERRPFLQDAAIRDEMHNDLGGICNNAGCPILRVGGVADHVHLLCRFGRTITVANLVQELKRESSKWVKTKGNALHDFHWQNGYGAFRSVRDTSSPCAHTLPYRTSTISVRRSRRSFAGC